MDDRVTPRATKFRPRPPVSRGGGAWSRFSVTDGSAAGLVVGYGMITVGLGIVVLIWPTRTLSIVAVLIGVQLLVAGIVQVILALIPRPPDGSRFVPAVLGALAFLAGLLALRAATGPAVSTLLAIPLVIGSWWIVSGVLSLIGGLTGGDDRTRTWAIVVGPLTFAAGAVVLSQPGLALPTLVFIVGFWFLVQGVLTIVWGMGSGAGTTRPRAPRPGAAAPEPDDEPPAPKPPRKRPAE